jgi:hypothetical protein
MAPLLLAQTPKTYREDPASDYIERMQLFRTMDFQFRDAVQEKYREEFSDTPYHESLPETRAKGIEMAIAHRRVHDVAWNQQRRRENAEVAAATRESYKHDLYHLDEMYSKHFKSLRVIPVTNRRERHLPLSKLPLI